MVCRTMSFLSISRHSRRLWFILKNHSSHHYATKVSGETTGGGRRTSSRLLTGGLVAVGVGFLGYVVGKHWTISIETTSDSTLCESKGGEPNKNHMEVWKKARKAERDKEERLKKAIDDARDLAQRIKDEVGSPGLVISVTVDGKTLWSEGFGFSDVENRIKCSPDSVMRIASISKPITMAIVAKLMEAGKIDIDKPVNEYVTAWPEKKFKGEKVNITTRNLVSHLGGIRHYDKTCKKEFASAAILKKKQKGEKNDENKSKKESDEKGDAKKKDQKSSEFDLDEYHTKEHYKTVTEALTLFKNDELCSKPGTDFLYTTHGWSLISAVAEGASGHDFATLLKGFFKDIGMNDTYMDKNDPIIYNRARFYVKNDRGRLTNAPFVDCSYKWAGGGLLSTVYDLNKFGNAMLYSFQCPTPFSYEGELSSDTAEDCNGGDSPGSGPIHPPGYLKSKTVKTLWRPVEKTKCAWDADGSYGMGWGVIPGMLRHGSCREQRFYVSHTGGAIGASSVLLVLPRKPEKVPTPGSLPRGVVVSMIVNLQSVGLNRTALEIAKIFEELD